MYQEKAGENLKSAIYKGKESVEVKEVEIPDIGENDVLVKNIYSSICGTDVAVYNNGTETGHRITAGEEFGHETVSRIVSIGKNVTDFRVGQRVYPYPRYAKGDTKRAGTIGAFSEYMLIPDAGLNHSLYLVPDKINSRTACLIEPFTISCRAARRSQPEPEDKYVIFGAGTIGIATAISLEYFGVSKIIICDKSDFRLDIAKQLGFMTCNLNNIDTVFSKHFGCADSLNGKTADIDCIIDCAGAESVFDYFMSNGKIESRFVSVAVNNAIRNLDLLHLTYSQKTIIGTGGYMQEDVFDVFNIMKSGKWNIEKIITHEFKLDDISKALQCATDTNSALNVIIVF